MERIRKNENQIIINKKKPQEETTYLVATVESKAPLRRLNLASEITRISNTKNFENKKP
jgi:hypothetical protein